MYYSLALDGGDLHISHSVLHKIHQLTVEPTEHHIHTHPYLICIAPAVIHGSGPANRVVHPVQKPAPKSLFSSRTIALLSP